MRLPAICLAMAGLAGLASHAAADIVTFTLLDPVRSVSAGGTGLAFDATVTAASTNAGDEYLNGVSENVAAPLTVDESPFFANFPFFLSPGESYTGLLFTVALPADAPVGSYLGTVTLQGGSDINTYETLGTQSFEVDVGGAPAVPEAATWAMMISGFGATGAAMRRRPRANGGATCSA